MAGTGQRAPDAWQVGWVAGGAVVVVTAGLLVTLTVLARRIAAQATAIERAIEGSRANVEPLLDLGVVNTTLARAVAAAGKPEVGR